MPPMPPLRPRLLRHCWYSLLDSPNVARVVSQSSLLQLPEVTASITIAMAMAL